MQQEHQNKTKEILLCCLPAKLQCSETLCRCRLQWLLCLYQPILLSMLLKSPLLLLHKHRTQEIKTNTKKHFLLCSSLHTRWQIKKDRLIKFFSNSFYQQGHQKDKQELHTLHCKKYTHRSKRYRLFLFLSCEVKATHHCC